MTKHINHTFLIFGYGIPKDILKDEKYSLYLTPVFNHIYRVSTEQKNQTVKTNTFYKEGVCI